MCQMKVKVLSAAGEETEIAEVTAVEVSGGAVTVSTFFDEPRRFAGAVVRTIDCLHGTVVVEQA